MQIVEQNDARLVLLFRPWGQALTCLSFMLFFLWGTMDPQDKLEPLLQGLSLGFAALFGIGVYGAGQRTRITLDRSEEAGTGFLAIATRTLTGGSFVSIPLSDFRRIEVVEAPTYRAQRRAQAMLYHRAPYPKSPLPLLKSPLRPAEAQELSRLITTWMHQPAPTPPQPPQRLTPAGAGRS